VITHSGSRDGLAELTRSHRISHILPRYRAWTIRTGRQLFERTALAAAAELVVRLDRAAERAGLSDQAVGGIPPSPRRLTGRWIFLSLRPLDDGGAAMPAVDRLPVAPGMHRSLFLPLCLPEGRSVCRPARLAADPRQAFALTHRYRLNTSFGLRLGRRAGATPFSSDFRLYGGNYWHTIRRECGSAARFRRREPECGGLLPACRAARRVVHADSAAQCEEISHIVIGSSLFRFFKFAPRPFEILGPRTLNRSLPANAISDGSSTRPRIRRSWIC